MHRIKNLLILAAAVVCFFIGGWVGLDNPDEITLRLLGFQLPPWTVGGWLVIFFAAGTALGILASLPVIYRFRSENRRLKRAQQGL